MDVLANNFPLENVAKFYGRIQKLSVTSSSSDVIVPSFGSMSVDGPLTQINLPRFESILAFEPEILYQGMGINYDIFHRLKVNTTLSPPSFSNATPSNQSFLRTNTILTRGYPFLLVVLLFLQIPNEGIVESSAAQTKEDLSLKCTTAIVYTLLNFGTGLATTGDVRIALMNVAATIALGNFHYFSIHTYPLDLIATHTQNLF